MDAGCSGGVRWDTVPEIELATKPFLLMFLEELRLNSTCFRRGLDARADSFGCGQEAAILKRCFEPKIVFILAFAVGDSAHFAHAQISRANEQRRAGDLGSGMVEAQVARRSAAYPFRHSPGVRQRRSFHGPVMVLILAILLLFIVLLSEFVDVRRSD
jgi:hypothetical protein